MTQRKQVAAAGAFIFDMEDRVFLAKFHNKFNSQWSIPGGKLDFGEGPLEAVIREVKEETNIDIQNPIFLEAGAFVVADTHVVYIDYIADCPEDAKIQLNNEFTEWGFFSEKEMNTIDVITKTKTTALSAMRFRSKKKWVEKLTSYNLGLVRKTVSLQENQKDWAQAYEWVHSQLLNALQSDYQIDHIGSTSIAKLPSKPILDIQMVYSDLQKFRKDIPALEQLGFSYKGDSIGKLNKSEADEDRHFLAFYNNEDNIDYVHLHVLRKGHPSIIRQIAFRDKLRANPHLTEEYKSFKEKLRKSGVSRQDYTLAKTDFVEMILLK